MIIDAGTGVQRIADERARQIAKEGWTPEHDDNHTKGELAIVAALYATPIRLFAKERDDPHVVDDRQPCAWGDSWPRVVLGAALILAASIGWAWMLKTVLAP